MSDIIMHLHIYFVLVPVLQESLASELAARMNAMNSASDNARDLKKKLSTIYNRKRQAKITSEVSHHKPFVEPCLTGFIAVVVKPLRPCLCRFPILIPIIRSDVQSLTLLAPADHRDHGRR